MRIEIDSTDIEIVKILYNLKSNENTNTYGVTKKIHPQCQSSQIGKYHTIIKKKLKKLNKYGIVKIIGDKFKLYELQVQNVEFKKTRFKSKVYNIFCFLKDGIFYCVSF